MFGKICLNLSCSRGLLHVSEIAWTKTEKVEDVLKVGDEVDVKLLEYDAKSNKMRLSMRALTEKPEGYVEPKGGSRGPRREGGNDRGARREGGERRGNDRGERRGNDRRNDHRGNNHGGDRRNSGRPEHAPAPQAADFKEPVEEIY